MQVKTSAAQEIKSHLSSHYYNCKKLLGCKFWWNSSVMHSCSSIYEIFGDEGAPASLNIHTECFSLVAEMQKVKENVKALCSGKGRKMSVK